VALAGRHGRCASRGTRRRGSGGTGGEGGGGDLGEGGGEGEGAAAAVEKESEKFGLQTLRATYILVLATGPFGLVGWTFFTEQLSYTGRLS